MTFTLDRLQPDEVVLALPDLHGRLQGIRLGAQHFVADVVGRGHSFCTYLLAADVEMRSRPGYAYDPWQSGFGDFTVVPDLATLRPLPWEPGTALLIGDPAWPDGSPVAVAPRQVLRSQLDRLAARNLTAHAGTELEFLVFRESYQRAHERSYAALTPATRGNVDYALVGLGDLEPVVRRIRREMASAGLALESARGECHPGQYEIVFRYDDALATCDKHAFYKTGAKAIAAQEGVALTFMPKYDAGDGNSCHVHLSLRSADGDAVFAAPESSAGSGMSRLMEHFVAGQLACLPELTMLFAPTVNAYKRLQPGGFAPTTVTWGRDNRTCAVRVIGTGSSLRIEHRVAGGDANPYLVVAAILAAGLHGVENELSLPPEQRGNANESAAARLPASLGAAADRFANGAVARKALGEAVVDHYTHAAREEVSAFDRVVTDWERARGFELR